MIWKETKSPDPPNVDPCQYGFEQERPGGMLIPRTVEAGVSLAPGFLLQLIRDAPFDFWGGGGGARLFLKKNVCFQISVKKNIC